MSTGYTVGLLRQTVSRFVEDRALTLGAALSYYAILALGPLLVIMVGIAGLVFGEKDAQGHVYTQLEGVVGTQGAATLKSMMASQTHHGGLMATVLGVVGLLMAASGLFGQLKAALNTIWRVKPKPGRGWGGLVFARLVSLLMVLGIGLILIASMVLTTLVSGFNDQVQRFVQLPGWTTVLLHVLVLMTVITLLFAMVFKWLPDVNIGWRDVISGALCTSGLFIVGEYLLSWYLGRQGVASSYGAAGSVVVLLMWIYYSSLILFLGAEFTKVRTTLRGSRVEPSRFAEPVEEPYFGLQPRRAT